MFANRTYTLILLIFLMGLTGCGRPRAAPPTATPPAPPTRAPVALAVAAPTVIPDRLTIPSIDLDIPVVELGWITSQDDNGRLLSEWAVAEYAAGWHKNSAQLGEPGNVVMSGHNNVLGAVFRELDQLRRGDTITVIGGDQEITYIVHDVIIVPEKYTSDEQRKENAGWIGPFDDDRLTLVSCWPRDDNTHRIIVVAFPAERLSGAVR
jgi:sortase A